MQPENKNISDLEYLAQLGFEKVGTNETDIRELQKKVKDRSFSYNNGMFFGIVSLLTGVFIGITVFFTIYNAPKIFTVPKHAYRENIPNKNTASIKTLDTVEVVAENFVLNRSEKLITKVKDELAITETAETLNATPITNINQFSTQFNESQIRYIPNAPVIFLHDMKITDYSLLYFRHNKFVALSNHDGLDPAYANYEETEKSDVLSPAYKYYLHQAIADAMLHFNKKNYSKCLSDLNIILEINPNDINCLFYSGMCFYHKKNYEAAIKNFNACLNHTNNTFLPEAQYYKALSLYEMGNKEEAIVLLKEIAKENSFYSEKAKKLLD